MKAGNRFFIKVGFATKELVLDFMDDAIREAKKEKEEQAKNGIHVSLFERTEDYGAVNISLK